MSSSRVLQLRVAGGADDWRALLDEDYLARLLRVIDEPHWSWLVEPFADDAHVGWEATGVRDDRAVRITLLAARGSAAPPSSVLFTLRMAGEPRAGGPPAARGGPWAIGLALAAAAALAAYERLGAAGAALVGVVVLLAGGLGVPRLMRRGHAQGPGDDPLDAELLDRLRRGAAQFHPFQLITPDWQGVN